jgi:hypothetical protein
MGTPATARKTPGSRKGTAKRTALRVVRTPKKRVKERPPHGKRFETERFGRPPKSATHLQLRRVSANGAVEKLLVNESGFEIDKFAIDRVSAEWIRRTFGAGHYRGNWFAIIDGKWKPLGQMQVLRLSSSTGSEVRQETQRSKLRTVGFPFPVPPAAAAAEEDRSIVSARVRAEREIAEMRIRTMTALEKVRLDGMREEHHHAMRRLEARMDELVRRRRREEEEEDAEPEPEAPPGPWDFLRPLIEQATPLVQQAIPVLFARLTGGPALPEPKKG